MPKAPKRQPATRRAQRRYDRLAVLDYIDTYQHAHQHSPSQRMIAQALEMSAPSVAYNAIHALERQGLLTIVPRPRGWPAQLHITVLGHQHLQEWRANRDAPSTTEESRS